MARHTRTNAPTDKTRRTDYTRTHDAKRATRERHQARALKYAGRIA